MCDSQLEKVSSCGSNLEKVSSVESLPPPPKSFDVVPELKGFKFKLVTETQEEVSFEYDLKPGRILPYSVKLKGFNFEFSKFLDPAVQGYSGMFDKLGGFWIFNLTGSEDDFILPRGAKRLKVLPSHDSNFCQTNDLDTSVASSLELDLSIGTEASSASSPPRASSPTPSSESSAGLSPFSGGTATVHQHPDWLRELKRNINKDVISVCSSRTREAVKNNEYIQDGAENRKVHTEIINVVLEIVKNVYGGAGNPARKDMREIVMELAFAYPEMFRERDVNTEGKRLVDKESDQARKLCDRFRERNRRLSGKQSDQSYKEPSQSPKEKLKKSYGIITDKLNKTKKMKPETISLISGTSSETDFSKREEVYKNYRPELTAEFLNSAKNLSSICRGIFLHPDHIGFHFEYMTNTPPLNQNIENNLRAQLDHLLIYLHDAIRTVEFKTAMEKVDAVTELEFNGSSQFKDIAILREACEHFDKDDGSRLIRFGQTSASFPQEADPANKSSSPHLVALLVEKRFIFEVWAEGKVLIGNMDLVTALATFFHVCFVFDLRYPKGGETVADILQRKVCKYGDNSGSRCWKRKDSAEKKRESYYAKIYSLTN